MQELAIRYAQAWGERNPDAIIALHRNLAQMEAVTTRAVAAFDAAREYLPDRAQPPPAGQGLGRADPDR